jgi:hypothetical protein
LLFCWLPLLRGLLLQIQVLRARKRAKMDCLLVLRNLVFNLVSPLFWLSALSFFNLSWL